MANICSIKIYIPLDKVPDPKEKEELIALYEAEKKWSEAVKVNDDLRRGINRDVFLASQPGVPYEKTKWSNFGGYFRGRPGEILKPDSEQWNTPTICASFEERDSRIWVHPVTFGRGKGLLFDVNDGISVHLAESEKSRLIYPTFIHIPMSWDFKHGFPWWAEIGFAGGEKICADKSEEPPEPPKGKDEKLHKKWYEKYGLAIPYLFWKLPVSKVLRNLEYAVKVYENFPVTGFVWQMVWVWKEFNQLKDIYKWIKQVYSICPEATGELNWGEVAWLITWEQARKDNSPNLIMSSVKEMGDDTNKLNSEKLLFEKFKKKYSPHLRRNRKDYKGYLRVANRDPFNPYDWFK